MTVLASPIRNRFLATSLLLGLVMACAPLKKGKDSGVDPNVPDRPFEEPEVVTGRSASTGDLNVQIELRPDGLLVHVEGIPAGSTIECDLNDQPLVPCTDGALFARPVPGDYRLAVSAVQEGLVTAVGASAPFTVLPDEDEAVIAANRLLLAAQGGFQNGQTVPLTGDLNIGFDFLNPTECADEPVVKCRYDSRTSDFWTDCDVGGKSYTVPADLMAIDLQYLSVQASCGDQLGPILSLYWYGVPENYEPLMLVAHQDNRGRQVLTLAKSDDCPQEDQRFQCADSSDADFQLCERGNVFDNPSAELVVRMSCGDQTGPAFRFDG